MDIEQIIDIAAPPRDVWDVLSDVGRWPEWTPSVSRVELLDEAPLRVGSRVRIRQPRLPVAIWTVTALETPGYFEWRNDAIGVKSVGGHRVEGVGDGGARVTLSLQWSGWLAPLIRLLYGNLSRRYVGLEARGLKQRCEGRLSG